MTKVTRILLAGGCALILAILLSFTHPFGNPRMVSAPRGHLLSGAKMAEPLRELVERKCGNCHSEAVDWPFYSHVAPISWLLEHDISEARAHMNLSRWETYSNQEKSDLLSRFGAQVRSGEMPPARYTAIHRDSKLEPQERESLYDWAREERSRIRTESQPSSSGQ